VRRAAAARAPGLAALVAGAACAALAGCHPRRPPPDLSADPVELLAAVRAEQARARTVQGQARVSVESKAGSGGVDQFLAAEKPGRVRVESLDFFGNVLSVLAVDGPELTLFDAKEKVFYRGAATRENVARLVPVPLSPEELATLLCGSAPLLDGDPVSAAPGDGVMVLTLRRGALTQVLEIGAGAAVEASRTRRDGGGDAPALLDADFTDLRTGATRGGLRLPTDVATRAPGVSLALHWRELTVNEAVDPALFRLAPPPGARVVDLDAAAP